MKPGLACAALLLLLPVFSGGCGTSSSKPGSSELRRAIDEDAGVRYELSGRHLRVEVLPGAPRFEDLFLGRGAFTFACATDPYGSLSEPAAEATGDFSADTRVAEVDLSADVSEDVILCYAEAPGGAMESQAWFVSPEELYGIHLPTEQEQKANEARARNAQNCVAFIKDIYEEFGAGVGEGLLAPGEPSTVPVKAYWFGPRLDKRRATVADSSMQIDYDEDEREVKVPMYTVMYQLPEDGCQSTFLTISSDEDFGFGTGHEIQLMSMPADSPTAQLYLNDPDVLAGSASYPARLSNGEEVTVYSNEALGFTVLTETTLVRMTEGVYGSEAAGRRLLPLLRPVGE